MIANKKKLSLLKLLSIVQVRLVHELEEKHRQELIRVEEIFLRHLAVAENEAEFNI